MPDTDLPQPSATRVTLRFRPPAHPDSPDAPVRDDLSACARVGDTLFLACDETTGIERLRRTGRGWGRHRHFDLAEFVDLPAGPEDEVDIEGLRVDDGWLWITGSHSLKRKKPKGGADDLDRLATVAWDPNRQFLGRVPLADTSEGPVPVAADGKRRAAHVAFSRRGALRKWLKGDAHVGAFLDIPSKENGLDVEGLAVRGLRVWLGLRGPVLRGHAVILEFEFKAKGGELRPRRIDGKARFRKHLIDTGGHGVRDLAFDGDDMLILTGTPLAGDGSAAVLRWHDAAACTDTAVHLAPAVTTALALPYADADDNPEGLTRWEGDTWLIVHDSPHPARLDGSAEDYHADVWHLTG